MSIKRSGAGTTEQLSQRVLFDAYDDFSSLVFINLLWILLTIPVVTAPAAAAGLYYATRHLAQTRSFSWDVFFEGFRQYFWAGWRWALAFLSIAGLLLINFGFYGQFQASWAPVIQGIILGLAIIWLLLQIYVFPLLLEQEKSSIRTALRNSLVLYLKKPGSSLVLVLFLLVVLVLSTILVLPWFLFAASLCAYLSNRYTLSSLDSLLGAKKTA